MLILALTIGSFFAGANPAGAATSSRERCLVNRINDERKSRGVKKVSMRSDLTAIARDWSRKMARAGDISHNSNLDRQVPGNWSLLGENVGTGYDLASVHEGFMDSRSHRANILRRRFNQAGVGIYVDKKGMTFITQVFVRRAGGSEPSIRCDSRLAYTGARSGVQGGRTQLAARLSDVSGPIRGKAIAFKVGGLTARATTDADGVARAWIVMSRRPGSYVITARYAGNSVISRERISRRFVSRWPHTFRDRIGRTTVYLNPSSKKFLVVVPDERAVIRRASSMETYALANGRMIISLSHHDGPIRFDGSFEAGSGGFAMTYGGRGDYRVLGNS